MFARVLIKTFLHQKGETNTLGVPPPKQIDDQKVKNTKPLSKAKKIKDAEKITIKRRGEAKQHAEKEEDWREKQEIT